MIKSRPKRYRAYIRGMRPEMAVVHAEAMAVYREFGYTGRDFVLTSGVEGEHGWGSDHFKGDAFDYRTKNLDEADRQPIADEISHRLGPDFDVILETDPPHIHVEFDPKSNI